MKNVLEALDSFRRRFNSALGNAGLLGQSTWTDLAEELNELVDLLNDPVISEPLDTFAIRKLSPIDRLNMGKRVLALAEADMKPQVIAQFFQAEGLPIDRKDVTAWLEEYQRSGITEKARVDNVFDSRIQMQMLYERILDQMKKIEDASDSSFRRNSKAEVVLAAISELRATIKDAHAIQKSEDSARQVQIFMETVLNVVARVSPASYYELYKELTAQRILLPES